MAGSYDVVILGAGHNGLVAASYLARAGLSVLILEKNGEIGGATTSQKVFPEYEARLSRYSYLVSLFPEKIMRDLGLRFELKRRTTGSFTPYLRHGRHEGLLLSNIDEAASRKSMHALTGNETEFEQLRKFYQLARTFAELSWESMLEPLRSREDFKQRFQHDELAQESWRSLVEEPVGLAIERYLQDDLVRGLALTDAKIGVFTHAHDPSLVQNRCFLYHLIGNKTGEWKVPVGGMGAVVAELERVALSHGVVIQTKVAVQSLDLTSKTPVVRYQNGSRTETVKAKFLLVNAGRNVLSQLTRTTFQPKAEDEGSVFKMNMLLERLPRLKAQSYSSAEAFCGTFHTDEGYAQMATSYDAANRGQLPVQPPGEVYCHTLTDQTILSEELRQAGYHTLTLFGLDTPWSIFAFDNSTMRAAAEKRFVASLDQWLEEPLATCLARNRDGSPCLESKSPVDIEDALGMYHGNIFHDAPSWPFTEREEEAGQWGVETEWPNVFFCGSSARRGGAVSGIPGHNAAMKVLETLRPS